MHITITGKLGSGKSTVAKKLVELYGFEIFSTGAILRAAAAERGMDVLELNKELSAKLEKMPQDAREKFVDMLQKIINDGSGGLICIIL